MEVLSIKECLRNSYESLGILAQVEQFPGNEQIAEHGGGRERSASNVTTWLTERETAREGYSELVALNMAIPGFLLVLLFLSCSLPALSLYEDQVGLMDWHQKYIGKVKQAVFQTQKAGRKRVVVSTEENVIASLDLRRGEIFWRHVLGANDAIDEIDIALGKYVITLSSEGSTLRAWNLPDGQMVWESFLSGSRPSKSLLFIPTNLKVDKDNVIFVYGNGCLHAVSSIDGEVLWKEFIAEGVEVQELIHQLGSDIIYAVGFDGLSQFVAFQIMMSC